MCTTAFPPEQNFPGNDWSNSQQHKQMSLECFCRLSFIVPNTPKRKKKKKQRGETITCLMEAKCVVPNCARTRQFREPSEFSILAVNSSVSLRSPRSKSKITARKGKKEHKVSIKQASGALAIRMGSDPIRGAT